MPESLSGSLAGKVAIVTGAARGIGFEIARTYAANGATVVVSDLDESAAKAAAAALPRATANACDVRDEAQVEALVAGTVGEHGKVDVVVANAGVVSLAPIVDMPFEAWRQVMSVNLDGVFLTVKHAARVMVAGGTRGSIVTMASVTATGGIPLAGHYAAAKAAVVNLTKTAAIELRSSGIRVNAILPGFAETELVTGSKDAYQAALGLDFDALMASAQGGYVDVADIAAVALFLAGDRSGFTTGAGYVVDGGLTASLL